MMQNGLSSKEDNVDLHYEHDYIAEHVDFYASCEKIVQIIPKAVRSQTGRIPEKALRQEETPGPLCFTFPNTHVKVHLFPTGSLQVWWTGKEKQQYYEQIKALLVPLEGYSQVSLKPKYAKPRIPFPGPKKLEVAWCSFKVKYSRVVSGLAGWLGGDWLERRAERKTQEKQLEKEEWDRGTRELKARADAKHEIMNLPGHGMTINRKFEIKQKWRKQHGLVDDD